MGDLRTAGGLDDGEQMSLVEQVAQALERAGFSVPGEEEAEGLKWTTANYFVENTAGQPGGAAYLMFRSGGIGKIRASIRAIASDGCQLMGVFSNDMSVNAFARTVANAVGCAMTGKSQRSFSEESCPEEIQHKLSTVREALYALAPTMEAAVKAEAGRDKMSSGINAAELRELQDGVRSAANVTIEMNSRAILAGDTTAVARRVQSELVSMRDELRAVYLAAIFDCVDIIIARSRRPASKTNNEIKAALTLALAEQSARPNRPHMAGRPYRHI